MALSGSLFFAGFVGLQQLQRFFLAAWHYLCGRVLSRGIVADWSGSLSSDCKLQRTEKYSPKLPAARDHLF